MIKKYFYSDQFYKNIIKKKKDPRIINEYKKILKYKNKIKFVFQNIPKGTGDAVLKTQKYIKNKYFLMLLPDDLIIRKNCSKSMINIHKKLEEGKYKTKMLLQVHDELVFDVHKSELEVMKTKIPELMMNAIQLDVPMDVEVGIGENWLIAH